MYFSLIRSRAFVWFFVAIFTLSSIPHVELVLSYAAGLLVGEASAAEAQKTVSTNVKAPPAGNQTGGKDFDKDPATHPIEPTPKPSPSQTATTMSMREGGDQAAGTGATAVAPQTSLFTGAAVLNIPIEVPPGRNNMAPNLPLTYNSYQGNGWLGVGWTLDMGSVQRSTKKGLSYTATGDGAFVANINGATMDLVVRSDWGSNYYGSKIEGSNSKFYLNPTTGGWEITTKDGIIYHYGTDSGSRQAFNSGQNVFKWLLDKVQDTNGNYMTVSYQGIQGDVYLDEIHYAGNANTGLGTSNYVKFYLDSGRPDLTPMFNTNYQVITASRLKTIDVWASGSRVRAYQLQYNNPGTTARSVLASVQEFGYDATLDGSGTVTGGTALPEIQCGWSGDAPGTFTSLSPRPSASSGWCDPAHLSMGDFNGDGKTDLICNADSGWHLVAPSNGDGSFTSLNYWPSSGGWCDPTHLKTGDFNGDGKTDLICDGPEG